MIINKVLEGICPKVESTLVKPKLKFFLGSIKLFSPARFREALFGCRFLLHLLWSTLSACNVKKKYIYIYMGGGCPNLYRYSPKDHIRLGLDTQRMRSMEGWAPSGNWRRKVQSFRRRGLWGQPLSKLAHVTSNHSSSKLILNHNYLAHFKILISYTLLLFLLILYYNPLPHFLASIVTHLFLELLTLTLIF